MCNALCKVAEVAASTGCGAIKGGIAIATVTIDFLAALVMMRITSRTEGVALR